MTKLNRLIVKKRWFVLFAIGMITFLIQAIFLVQSNVAIQNYPILKAYEARSKENWSKVVYTPQVDAANYVVTPSKESQEKFYEVLEKNFSGHIYLASETYFTTSALETPEKLSREQLKNIITSEYWNINDVNHLLVKGVLNRDRSNVISESKKLGLALDIKSVKDILQDVKQEYRNDYVFGILAILILLVLIVVILLFVIKSILKILKDEIRIYRLVGTTTKQITFSMKRVLSLPIVVFGVLFVCLEFSLLRDGGLPVYNFIISIALSLLTMTIISIVTDFMMRRLYDVRN
ncbi:hypothetical protein RyT2_29030 [Pseudolactococcus yaeyamensis]